MKLKVTEWKRIFPREKRRDFFKGEVMVLEGGLAKDLIVILTGKARVEKRIRGRDPLVLARLGAGEILGELSILTGRRRSATVVAESGVSALIVPGAKVRKLLGSGDGGRGRFQRQMMDSLAMRLVRLLEQLPMYQGAWREPRTAAAVRSALEKMYAGWAI